MADQEKPEKRRAPGAPSAFADVKGGPANFGGVDFQVRYTVLRMVQWLTQHWGDTTGTGAVRCEPRLVHLPVEGDGAEQHGFDVAVTGWAGHAPEYLEAKRTPTHAEVLELVASLAQLPVGVADDIAVGLVAEADTADYRRLVRLHRYANEAGTDAELTELVAAAGDEKLTALLAAAGREPRAVIRGMREPELVGESELTERVRWMTLTLAGGEEPGVQLIDRLRRTVEEASRRRELVSMPELQVALISAGLLQPAPAGVAPENEELASVHVVLEACPMPVPKELLARAMKMTVAQLEEDVLRLSLESHAVLEADGGWYRVPVPGQSLATEFAEPLAGDLLEVYAAVADSIIEAASGHTLNALALARICQDSRPEVVARVFQAYDKACKRWGDIGVVLALANLSEKALEVVFARELTAIERSTFAYVRAQTYICGQGWVMQRVDELPAALGYMEVAKGISEHYRDDVNHAFTLKCEGRLQRMLADRERDEVKKAELLTRSAELLREAESAFKALVDQPAHRRLVADHGECPSLLARTLATAGDLDGAWREVGRAKELLAEKPDSKQYADLMVLEAELFMRGDPAAEGYTEGLAQHRATLLELVERFDTDGHRAPGGRDRSASEIAGRLHHTLGLIALDTDPAAAEPSFRRAADLFGLLEHGPWRQESLLRARASAGELIPDSLEIALEEVGAGAGVRLLAMDRARDLSTAAGAGSRLGGSSPEGSTSVDEWREIVRESQARYAAERPRWNRKATA